jgi:hypothetical protein
MHDRVKTNRLGMTLSLFSSMPLWVLPFWLMAHLHTMLAGWAESGPETTATA